MSSTVTPFASIDEAVEENLDVQTRRETFELELMAEGRSSEGSAVALDEHAGRGEQGVR